MDIQDAYLPMARSVRKYLRFMVNGRVYHFTCLPFGLATSPREFTKLLWPVVQLLRLQGIKLHVYLNNWLIPSSSVVQARTHADLVLQVLQHLGWVINFNIFRNAVCTSRGAYSSVTPRGEGLAKASMVHLSQDDKPEKVAWSVQRGSPSQPKPPWGP